MFETLSNVAAALCDILVKLLCGSIIVAIGICIIAAFILVAKWQVDEEKN